MDKEKQKKLLIEIIEADEKDGLYELPKPQTAVEWLIANLPERFKNAIINTCVEEIKQAKEVELEIRKEDFKTGYRQGYLDAQCNHINDVDTSAEEFLYIKSE